MNATNHPSSQSTPASGRAIAHESAVAQVSGAANYVDDIPEVRGTLYAAPIMSNVAHGRLRNMDASVALAMPGVRGVVQARDIPGNPVLASFAGDEPVFASDTVQYVGQVVGVILAETTALARRAARLVKLDIEVLPAVLTVKDALQTKNYILPPVFVKRGDAAPAISAATNILHGELEVGGQEHFYLEGQVAYALPQEQNQW
ncbi:MAG: molybdopterin cofactor-binding domain-containing protein, partial [Burkholderiaceae bacterium]